MGSILGVKYAIIEDGLNGRTVLNASPVNIMANGIECIRSVVHNYMPFDIAIIGLGINDVFIIEDVTVSEISRGIEEIIDIIRENHKVSGFKFPEIIIMSPPAFNTSIDGVQFFELPINKLKSLPDAYRELSVKKNCMFFNASDYVTGSPLDGSHLEAVSHKLLAERIAEFITDSIE